MSSRLRCLLVGACLMASMPAFAGQGTQTVVPGETRNTTGGCGRPTNEWFRDRGLFDPLIADVRAPQIAFNYPAWAPEMPHSDQGGRRRVWEVTVGRELPLFARTNITDATKVAGCSGWGIWADVSFHVLEDFKDDSSPIVNTDYRFSLAKFKYYRILTKGLKKTAGGPIATYKALAVRVDGFHHESTHLGDEYVLFAQALTPAKLAEREQRPFERFNVSYEFFDVGAAFNWEDDAGQFTTIRGGTTGLLKPGKGYYSDHTLEPGQRPVVRSNANFEPYVQFEHHWPHPRVASEDAKKTLPTRDRFKPFVSVDARHRIVLDFYKASEDDAERRQWSFNVLGGVRSWSGGGRFSIKEIYLRAYHGVNPNGQLRMQPDYWQVGLGVNIATGER
jgi:hypothetical protein